MSRDALRGEERAKEENSSKLEDPQFLASIYRFILECGEKRRAREREESKPKPAQD